MKKNKRIKESKSKNFKEEIISLADFLSGETELKEKEEKLKELKAKSLERRKSLERKEIVKGKKKLLKIDEMEEVSQSKIVQNIKLFKWEAPARVSIVFNLKVFLAIVALSLIFILYLAILGHYGLMAVIIALLFVLYVAGTVSPEIITNYITARGVDYYNKLYEWYILNNFWFSNKNGQYLLMVETKLRAPARLVMLVDRKEIPTIFMLLQDKLLYKEIKKQNRLELLGDGKYIPLEEI